MKMFVTAITLLMSLSVFAESIKVFESNYYGRKPTVNVQFRDNKKLDRAWLDIEVDNSDADSDIGYDSYRQKVEGLSYSKETNSIVLDRNGKTVECATWKKGGFFSLSYWKPTNCTFETKFVKRDVDNGFEIRTKKFVEVYLNVAE